MSHSLRIGVVPGHLRHRAGETHGEVVVIRGPAVLVRRGHGQRFFKKDGRREEPEERVGRERPRGHRAQQPEWLNPKKGEQAPTPEVCLAAKMGVRCKTQHGTPKYI